MLPQVHVHTNDPSKVFDALRPHAVNKTLIKEKAEDMGIQIRAKAFPPVPDTRGAKVGWGFFPCFFLSLEMLVGGVLVACHVS